jgi:hypothetical protein
MTQDTREQSAVHDEALRRRGIRFDLTLACRLFGHLAVPAFQEEWPNFQGIHGTKKRCLFCELVVS